MSSTNKLNWSTGCVVLGLAFMLWLPIGQYPFLIQNWMKVGTFIIPFILLMALSFQNGKTSLLDDPKTASALMLAAYLAHQFEEHWIDAFGEHYAFYSTVNTLLNGLLDTHHFIEILTPAAIFFINTSLVWMIGAIAIWRSPASIFPSLALAGIMIVNAVTHIVSGVLKGAYNPGLLTSVFVFVPLAGTYYLKTLKRLPTKRNLIFLSLGWAIFAHILMVGGMLAATWLKLIPETTYFVLIILWSLLPAILFRHTS